MTRRELRLDPAGVITRQQLLADGWTPSAVRHALASGRLIRLRGGAYAAPVDGADPFGRMHHLRRALGASHTCRRAVPSHTAAAVAWDLPVLRLPPQPCVTVDRGTALRELTDVHLHRAPLPAAHLVRRPVGRVTSPARTALDIGREHGLADGLVVADAALARSLVTAAEFRGVVRAQAGWPGVRRGRAALALADGLAESPLESVSRLRIGQAGLPMPQLQVEIFTVTGWHVARVDFYWPQFGVVGEADGNDKYDARAVLVEERQRQQRLEDLGLVVVRWGWRDLRTFTIVARRLQAAFGRGIPFGDHRPWLAHAPRSVAVGSLPAAVLDA